MPKLITVSQNLLEDLLPYLKGTKYDDKIQALLDNTSKYLTQDITYFPKQAKVERVVDGDTVVLHNGTIVRYVGITSPESNQPFDKRSLRPSALKNPQFGRILA